MTGPNYFSFEEIFDFVDEPNRSGCLELLKKNDVLFKAARGSTHNHQTWVGGWYDHTLECVNYAYYLYKFDESFGRPLPFSLSDAILIMFLHDLEKPWRIEVLEDGSVRNRPGLDTKEAFKQFREDKLQEYGIALTPYQLNGLTYVEGEIADYSSKRRVMNELAAFCHKVDVWSARAWYDYPKIRGQDEWAGAGRVNS